MTPEEKAREILNKIEGSLGNSLPNRDEKYFPETIDIAVICVDEIINAHFMKRDSSYKTFWLNVQQEIKKL